MRDDENPLMNGMIELEPVDDVSMQRRDLFRGAGTLAAFLAANRSAAQATQPDGRMPEAKLGPLLPLVPFGKNRITRLVAGDPVLAEWNQRQEQDHPARGGRESR